MKTLKVNIFCTKGIKIKLADKLTIMSFSCTDHNDDTAGQNEDDMGKSSQMKQKFDTPKLFQQHHLVHGLLQRDVEQSCALTTCMARLGEACSHIAALLFAAANNNAAKVVFCHCK